MERLTYRFSLDTHKNGSQRTLQGFETGDTLSRRFIISLKEDERTYDLPLDNVVAVMYVKSPDGTLSVNNCTIKDNEIIYDLTNECEQQGIVEMQLKIVSGTIANPEAVIVSPRFNVEVWESFAADSEAEATQTFTSLEAALIKAQMCYDARIVDIQFADDFTLTIVYGYDEDTQTHVTYTTDIFKDAASAMRSIDHISKTGTSGLVDTYTVYYTSGDPDTFTVTNGEKGDKGDTGDKGDKGDTGTAATIEVGSVTSGETPSVTNSGTSSQAVFDFVLPKGDKGDTGNTGANGNGIASIEKTGTSGLVDTYTITYTDGTTTTFTVTNGQDGTGAGDMTKLKYDPDNTVYDEGGIPNYVHKEISIDSADGNPIVLDDAYEGSTKSLKLDIEPIQEGSGTPSPDNVRPISGISSGTITRTGKNLCADVNVLSVTTAYETVLRLDMELMPSTTYVFSFVTNNGNTYYTNENLFTEIKDITGTSGRVSFVGTTKSEISKSNSVQYQAGVGWRVLKNRPTVSTNPTFTDVQVELGSTNTAYEPYNGQTITRTYGQTVYGGSDDVTGSGATSTWAEKDLGSINYTYNPYDLNFYSDLANLDAKYTGGYGNGICEVYEQKNVSGVNMTDGSFRIYADRIYVKDSRTTTGSTLKSLLNGVKLVYEKATPTAISLASQNIDLLHGDNVITTNAKEVHITGLHGHGLVNKNTDGLCPKLPNDAYHNKFLRQDGTWATDGKWVTDYGEAGDTSITISDAAITATSILDLYSNDSVNYDSVTVSTGSVTYTFPALESDTTFRLWIREA